MKNEMKDKNGTPLKIGDRIIDDFGDTGIVAQCPEIYCGSPAFDGISDYTVWVDWNSGVDIGKTILAYLNAVSKICKAMKPRPHHDLIVQWAQDENVIIQWKNRQGEWRDLVNPQFLPNEEYRIKPETIMVKKYRYSYATKTYPDGYMTVNYYSDSEWQEELTDSNITGYTRLNWTMKEIEVEAK